MKKATILVSVLLVLFGFTVLPAVAFEAPVITLERVEVVNYQPFFVTKAKFKDELGKEKEKKFGAILNTAYVLNIKNPNKEPVMLDELTFTINFDGFDVNTVTSYDDSWIPAGKTNQVRVLATNSCYSTLLSLMVSAPNVELLKTRKTKAAAVVKGWWDAIPTSATPFPIAITGGTALFSNEKGDEVRVTFTGEFGGKKAEGSGKK